MTRTHEKVRYSPEGKVEAYTPAKHAEGAELALKVLEGRWKMIIIFHLFVRPVLRFSELERAIPAVSQKMLIQQLRELERRNRAARSSSSGAPQGRVWFDRVGTIVMPCAGCTLKVGCIAQSSGETGD